MAGTIDDLQRQMQAAAEAMDFELASRLRDRINLMRGGASEQEAASADTTGLSRQRNGAMGLGTSQAKPTPPPDWKPPRRPDAMTANTGRKRR